MSTGIKVRNKMAETKSALKSTGVWGSILAMVPGIDHILSTLAPQYVGLLPDAVSLIVGTAGAVLALWGRVKATKQIKGIL